MARPAKISSEQALSAAMPLFWEFGYFGLDTRTLEARTGLTRFSLNRVWGGKHKFYLAVMDAYLAEHERALLPPVDIERPKQLADWFLARVWDELPYEAMDHGCFMQAALSEWAGTDAEVEVRGQQYFDQMRSRFRVVLDNMARAKLLGPRMTPELGAEVLVASFVGLNSTIRMARNSQAGQPMAEAIAALIRSWAI